MIDLQILNKVLATKDDSILLDNCLTVDYFPAYQEEYEFIENHKAQYGNIPDIETFLLEFENFQVLTVAESDRYLIDAIREEFLYSKSVPVVKKVAELLKSDANVAAQYLQSEIPNLQPMYEVPAVDIIHDRSREDEFIQRSENPFKYLITTGLPELDACIGGLEEKEELVTVVARINQGKSWIGTKLTTNAWELGKNVCFISPEMSANKIGYRFDSLSSHLSNLALMRGDTSTVSVEEYRQHLDELEKHENKFYVATPAEFNREITVSKLRSFIKTHHIQLLCIDGITYLTDERAKRNDNTTTKLTHISEDLIQLSIECELPIIVVIQANRNGVNKEDKSATPELEDIKDSDGVGANATKVISLRQKEGNIMLSVKKNRYGRVGDKVTYAWDIDHGEFTYVPNPDDTVSDEHKQERIQELEDTYTEKGRKFSF